MWNSIKERIFPFIIALSALSVSASAAVYSVTGLSMLFAGASTAVIIMAASLEVSKLVIASLLYQYWGKLNKILRTYLTIAASVLILITSAGIYGYLSSAYQKTADQTSIVDSKVASLETKKKLYENTRAGILQEKQSLSELKGTLSKGSTTQYTDRKGNLVVRSNNASIKQIESASKSDEKLSSKLDVVNDSIFALETKILEIKTNATATSELGPLKYLSQLTGVAMDRIINWYILVIIFVFDPLAIALVIAANFAFAQLIKRKETPIEEKVEDMRKVVEAYDDLQEEINIPEKDWIEDWPSDNDEELEEASLQDLQDWYKEEKNIPEPNDDLKQATKEYESQQNIYGEDPTKLVGLDSIENKITDEKTKPNDLDPKTIQKINKLNQKIDGIIDNVQQYYSFNPEELNNLNNQIEDIKRMNMELGSLKSKKDDGWKIVDDEDTITYF